MAETYYNYDETYYGTQPWDTTAVDTTAYSTIGKTQQQYALQYVDQPEYDHFMTTPAAPKPPGDYQAYMYQEYGYVYQDPNYLQPMTTTTSQSFSKNLTIPPPPLPPMQFGAQVFQPPMFNYDSYYSTEQPQTVPPPPPPVEDYNTQKMKRKATTYFANPEDEEFLPAELKALFLPLQCDLCDVKMNSSISATLHYQAKTHDKKITAWLEEWCKVTGSAMPQRKKRPKNVEGPTGINALHCDLCDIALTSVQHANQHYLGKKHRFVVSGKANPDGAGYYNAEGKWIRTVAIPNDPSGRFGIGTAFQSQTQTYTISTQQAAVPQRDLLPPRTAAAPLRTAVKQRAVIVHKSIQQITTTPPPIPGMEEYIKPPRKARVSDVSSTTKDETLSDFYRELEPTFTLSSKDQNKDTYCVVCDISVTSAIVMQTHLAGIKHARKLKSIGAAPYATKVDTLLSSLGSTTVALGIPDLSIYRTPSGHYYCKTCDSTASDEALFNQHMNSKKHKRNNR